MTAHNCKSKEVFYAKLKDFIDAMVINNPKELHFVAISVGHADPTDQETIEVANYMAGDPRSLIETLIDMLDTMKEKSPTFEEDFKHVMAQRMMRLVEGEPTKTPVTQH